MFYTEGEIIDESGEAGSDVTIRIIKVQKHRMRAVVVKTTRHWARNGLTAGRELVLVPGFLKNIWVTQDQALPWFTLMIGDDGKKKFVHYR